MCLYTKRLGIKLLEDIGRKLYRTPWCYSPARNPSRYHSLPIVIFFANYLIPIFFKLFFILLYKCSVVSVKTSTVFFFSWISLKALKMWVVKKSNPLRHNISCGRTLGWQCVKTTVFVNVQFDWTGAKPR